MNELQNNYEFDESTRVWGRRGAAAQTSYSDGDEVEGRLLQIVQEASDVGADSEELAGRITDWPTLYHLSPQRLNLLRPLRRFLTGRILEVGAGCGAVTRYLGETGAQIVALEASARRAAIAAARCRDLTNVSVVCDEFSGLAECVGTFDCILLIGVLEWSGLFESAGDPAHALLERCRGRLAEGGSLIVAIENQLGLKYFAGAPEDHTGEVFFGINDLYSSSSRAVTFGRRALTEKLAAAGFGAAEFLYPFPDYKLPALITQPSFFRQREMAAAEVLQHFATAGDQGWNYARLFSERAAWSVLFRNGLAEELANSFLIVASKERSAAPKLQADVLAYSYSVTRRRAFQKENRIRKTHGRLRVERRRIHQVAEPEGGPSRQRIAEEAFLPGSPYSCVLYRILDTPGWRYRAVEDWFRAYYDLLRQITTEAEGQLCLPPEYLDCTPFNIIQGSDGALTPFDLEWVASQSLPLDSVLFRGLVYTLNNTITVAQPGEELDLGVIQLTRRLMSSVGRQVGDAEVETLWEQEEAQQKWVVGDHARINRDYWRAARLSIRPGNILREASKRDGELDALQMRVAESNRRLEELERQRTTLMTAVAKQEGAVRVLEGRLADREAVRESLFALRSAAVKQSESVAALTQRLSSREEELKAAHAQLQSRSEELAQRAEQASELSGRLSASIVTIAALREEEARLGRVLEAIRENLEREREAGREKAAELRSQMAEVEGTLRGRLEDLARREVELIAARSTNESLGQRLTEAAAEAAKAGVVAGEHRLMAAECEAQMHSLRERTNVLQEQAQRLAHAAGDSQRHEEEQRGLAGRRLAEVYQLATEISQRDEAAAVAKSRASLSRDWKNPRRLAAAIASRSGWMWRRQRARALARIVDQGLFDPVFYVRRYPETAGDGDLLAHYLTRGVAENKNPNPVFNTRFYLAKHPDVSESGLEPLVHYALFGAAEKRRPNWLFDPQYYVRRYPMAASDPVAHYLAHWEEGYSPHPLFDSAFYLEAYPDVAAARDMPLWHYLESGHREGRQPHPLFDPRYYTEQAGPAAAANPLRHFCDFGSRADLNPHPLFDTAFYRQQTDLAEEVPLIHFLMHGAKLRLNPHPLFDSSYYLDQNPDVANAGMNPVVHYLKSGAREGKAPHPLFDAKYYIDRAKSASGEGINALLHYVTIGARAGESPHPLFDARYYLRNNPDVATAGLSPLVHYLTLGYLMGGDPHPLFDTTYYQERNPDVVRSGAHPLLHYLQSGGFEGRKPHPLFDPEFYLQRYPDVARARMNPLVHYVTEGMAEGRWPNPLFDPHYYFAAYPDLSSSTVNALEHYWRWGAAEGRDPHPEFCTRLYLDHHPEVARQGLNPLQHYLENAQKERPPETPRKDATPRSARNGETYLVRNAGTSRPGPFAPMETVLCVTHVPVYPPRAGNEYRIFRMLDHLQGRGYRVVLLLAPLPGEELDEMQFKRLASHFPHSVMWSRNGEVLYAMAQGGEVLEKLQGARPETIASRLGEDGPKDSRTCELLSIERNFCPDAVAHLALRLQAGLGRCAVLSQYVFMTRFLPLVGSDSMKIVDTHDVFSSKEKKVVQFGIRDTLSLSGAEERERLLRADRILAIQPEEGEDLAALVPERRVLRVGVDFEVAGPGWPAGGNNVLYVASSNSMNVKGLKDFLRFAWPRVARAVPDAVLVVAGKVGQGVVCGDPRVQLLGPVDEIERLYQNAGVGINPSVAGTGLKIKTVEGLCHFRPVVSWPSGIEGMEPELCGLCLTAEDWYQFSDRVIEALGRDREVMFSAGKRERIRQLLAADTVYAELTTELETFFGHQAPDAVRSRSKFDARN